MSVKRRFQTTAVQVWINVSAILSLVVWLHGAMFIPSGDAARDVVAHPRADFMMFYGSAVLLRTSPHDLYDVNRQSEAQKTATNLDMSASDIDFLPYPYPAIVALMFIPFTMLNYRTAYMLTVILNLTLLGITLWLLSTRLKLSREANQVLVLCASASISVYATLLQGQVSFLVLLLYVLVITNLQTGNEGRAGIWAGFLAFKPPLLPIWLFWFAVRRRWRALAGAFAGSGAVALVSVLAVGVEGSVGYVSLSRRVLQGDFTTVLPTDMPTLRSLTYFFGLPQIAWFGAVAILLLVLWKTNASGNWEYCIVIFSAILGAAHMHPHELVLLLIVVALLLVSTEIVSRRTTWALLALFLWQDIVRFVFAGTGGTHWPVMPVTLIILLSYFLYAARSAVSNASLMDVAEINR